MSACICMLYTYKEQEWLFPIIQRDIFKANDLSRVIQQVIGKSVSEVCSREPMSKDGHHQSSWVFPYLRIMAFNNWSPQGRDDMTTLRKQRTCFIVLTHVFTSNPVKDGIWLANSDPELESNTVWVEGLAFAFLLPVLILISVFTSSTGQKKIALAVKCPPEWVCELCSLRSSLAFLPRYKLQLANPPGGGGNDYT